ncbi:MAG: galactokinase [Candidatus Hydrogenedentes bacterium]|nr:galactokinase [Candidatus Hydrogenedentota bacterium]
MGGNDDYTGGLVFEATIREATFAAVQLRDDDRIVFFNPAMREKGWLDRVEFDFAELTDEEAVRQLVSRDPGSQWTSYILGAFYLLRERFPLDVTKGANVYIESTVPLNKGVSSSAALEVAVMKPAAKAYGVDLAGVDLATACQWVENVIARSACGIMDQITVVLGDDGYILPLVCQPCMPEPLIRLPESLQCWAIDSGVSHCVSGIEYEAARAAAFMGYKLMCDWEGLPVTHDESGEIPRWVDARWNGYLANVSVSEFRAKFENRLPEAMTGADYLKAAKVHVDPFTEMRPEYTYRVRANTRYAVEENARVRLFAELARGASLEESTRAFELMGDLMYLSHHAYSECGLGAEATDLLVSLAREEGAKNGIYGAKITGGGAGGTVALLGLRGARAAFQRIVDRYAEARGFTPYVFEGSSMGADRFGVVTLEA